MIQEIMDNKEFFSCPNRLNGLHGDWHSMPIEIIRVSDEEYKNICEIYNLD